MSRRQRLLHEDEVETLFIMAFSKLPARNAFSRFFAMQTQMLVAGPRPLCYKSTRQSSEQQWPVFCVERRHHWIFSRQSEYLDRDHALQHFPTHWLLGNLCFSQKAAEVRITCFFLFKPVPAEHFFVVALSLKMRTHIELC